VCLIGREIWCIIFDTRSVRSFGGRFIVSGSKGDSRVYIIFSGNTRSEIGQGWHLTSMEMRVVIMI
jgi:hypothetical protein